MREAGEMLDAARDRMEEEKEKAKKKTEENDLFYLGWTPRQFDAWEAETVTIPLELLDNLRMATRSLGEGRQIADERIKDVWLNMARDAWELLQPHIEEIDKIDSRQNDTWEDDEFYNTYEFCELGGE